MTDSDQAHRAVKKNGHDKLQDRDLRELRLAIDKQREADVSAHGDILKKLDALDKDVLVTHVRDEEKMLAEKSLRRQLAALALLFVTTMIGLVAWAATEFRDIHRDIANNTAHFREFQAIGIEWGDAIDERADGFKEDIRRIRKQLNEHRHDADHRAHER